MSLLDVISPAIPATELMFVIFTTAPTLFDPARSVATVPISVASFATAVTLGAIPATSVIFADIPPATVAIFVGLICPATVLIFVC